MTVLRESPWYQEIWREAERQGRQKWEQQGEQRGLWQGFLSGITLGLKLKFGLEGLQLLPEIREIDSVETLKNLHAAIETANTVEELRQLYI